jgi:hypothetical protein
MVVPPGISSSWLRNQTGKIKMVGKSSKQEQFQEHELKIIFPGNANLKK